MDLRHAVGAAAFTGLLATGITGAGVVAGQLEVDGVAISMLESADYMPPPPDATTFVVDGVPVTVLESADYMPPEEP